MPIFLPETSAPIPQFVVCTVTAEYFVEINILLLNHGVLGYRGLRGIARVVASTGLVDCGRVLLGASLSG